MAVGRQGVAAGLLAELAAQHIGAHCPHLHRLPASSDRTPPASPPHRSLRRAGMRLRTCRPACPSTFPRRSRHWGCSRRTASWWQRASCGRTACSRWRRWASRRQRRARSRCRRGASAGATTGQLLACGARQGGNFRRDSPACQTAEHRSARRRLGISRGHSMPPSHLTCAAACHALAGPARVGPVRGQPP